MRSVPGLHRTAVHTPAVRTADVPGSYGTPLHCLLGQLALGAVHPLLLRPALFRDQRCLYQQVAVIFYTQHSSQRTEAHTVPLVTTYTHQITRLDCFLAHASRSINTTSGSPGVWFGSRRTSLKPSRP